MHGSHSVREVLLSLHQRNIISTIKNENIPKSPHNHFNIIIYIPLSTFMHGSHSVREVLLS